MSAPAYPTNPLSYVEDASRMARIVANARMTGPGTLPRTLAALAREVGATRGMMETLRYRPERMKSVPAHVWDGLRRRYEREVARGEAVAAHLRAVREAMESPEGDRS